MLYVPQSLAHQVLHNRESRALQYAMRDRLTSLGWHQIETIDDDLGRSAAGGVVRAGFERIQPVLRCSLLSNPSRNRFACAAVRSCANSCRIRRFTSRSDDANKSSVV